MVFFKLPIVTVMLKLIKKNLYLSFGMLLKLIVRNRKSYY